MKPLLPCSACRYDLAGLPRHHVTPARVQQILCPERGRLCEFSHKPGPEPLRPWPGVPAIALRLLWPALALAGALTQGLMMSAAERAFALATILLGVFGPIVATEQVVRAYYPAPAQIAARLRLGAIAATASGAVCAFAMVAIMANTR